MSLRILIYFALVQQWSQIIVVEAGEESPSSTPAPSAGSHLLAYLFQGSSAVTNGTAEGLGSAAAGVTGSGAASALGENVVGPGSRGVGKILGNLADAAGGGGVVQDGVMAPGGKGLARIMGSLSENSLVSALGEGLLNNGGKGLGKAVTDLSTMDGISGRGLLKEATGTLGDKIQGLAHNVLADSLNTLLRHSDDQLRFLLFTKNNPGEPDAMPHDGSIEKTHFDPNEHVKVIIHGFEPTGSTFMGMMHLRDDLPAMIEGLLYIKDKYMERNATHNVIIVDWTAISATINYVVAASATRFVGAQVGKYLYKLVQKGHSDPDKIHVIGHSLGAHTAGITGKSYSEESGGVKLARITGLDPAGPGFDLFLTRLTVGSRARSDQRFMINKDDGKFVDNIHCNAQGFGGLGMLAETGTADFWPNGGGNQPGCGGVLDNLSKSCSHSTCLFLFGDSVLEDRFPACPCTNFADYQAGLCNCTPTERKYMGDTCNPNAKGSYYLTAYVSKKGQEATSRDMEKEKEKEAKEVKEKEEKTSGSGKGKKGKAFIASTAGGSTTEAPASSGSYLGSLFG